MSAALIPQRASGHSHTGAITLCLASLSLESLDPDLEFSVGAMVRLDPSFVIPIRFLLPALPQLSCEQLLYLGTLGTAHNISQYGWHQ